jgi:TPR repeat protein
MKKALLFVFALAVIPVGVDAQAPDLEEMRALAEQGDANAQYNLGVSYANGLGVPEDDAEAVRWYRLAACPVQPRGYVRQW